MEEQIIKILQKALEAAEKTGEFVVDQAPMLLQEFYNWHLFKNVFLSIIGVVVIISLFYVFKKLGSNNEKDFTDTVKILGKYYNTIGGWVLFVFMIWADVLLGLVTIKSILNTAQLIIVPKIYLLEYFADKL